MKLRVPARISTSSCNLTLVAGYVFAYVSPMWSSVATILALGAAASPVSLEAAAGFEAVASKLAGQPSKLPDVVKSRLKLVKLHCAVLTNRPQSWACTRVHV